jgi:hypothetical protein
VAEGAATIAADLGKNGAVAASKRANGVHYITAAATDADNVCTRRADLLIGRGWCEASTLGVNAGLRRI